MWKTVYKTVSKTVWKTVWKTGRSSGLSAPVQDMQDISAWQDMNRIEPLGSTIRDLQTSMTLPLGTRNAARENSREFSDVQEPASPLVLLFLLLLIIIQNAPTPRALCDLIKGVGALASFS